MNEMSGGWCFLCGRNNKGHIKHFFYVSTQNLERKPELTERERNNRISYQ